MQFIRLKTFRFQFPGINFPLTPEQAADFRTRFYELFPGSVLRNEKWISLLSDDAAVLFMGWIEEEEKLAETLSTQTVSGAFQDKSRLTKHALFNQFREFVTPFLFPVLEKESESQDHTKLANILSYCQLLTENRSEQVQSAVYDLLKAEQEEMERTIARAASGEALSKAVQPYLRPGFIELLNGFGPAFYRARTNWMEAFFSVTGHPNSSRQLVLHIARQLAPLNLNEEHSREIRQLNKDVKSGNVRVEKFTFPFRRAIVLFLGCATLVAICWFAWSIPAKPDAIAERENKTSFMSFSVAERMAMDSLLRQVTYHRQQANSVDEQQSVLPYVGIDLQLKEPWKNKTAEKLLDSWQLSDSAAYGYPDPANSQPDDRPFPSTQKLSAKNGAIEAIFSNPTQLSVFVMVFKDKTGEPVYSGYISKGTAKTFRLDAADVLFVMPGSKVPNDLKLASLPFGEVDEEFFANMRNRYVVAASSPAAIKLVWKNVQGAGYLLDLNGALTR